MMAAEADELDVNPFYKALQTTYLNLFERAQNQCYLICVPQTVSLMGVVINSKLIETHLLKPSPYFKGQYFTSSSKHKLVYLREKMRELRTGEGFSQENVVRILSEENGYNKDYKPYRIFIIEKPLNSNLKTTKNFFKPSASDFFSPKPTAEGCRQWLCSFPEYKEVVSELNKSISQFNSSYMVLIDYLDDTASHLRNICMEVTKLLQQFPSSELLAIHYWGSNYRNRSLRFDHRLYAVLSSVIESYLMEGVYDKIFPVICEKFRTQDEKILKKCNELNGLTNEKLGIKKEFSCDLPDAIENFLTINELKTPAEKILSLKITLAIISEAINRYLSKNYLPGKSPVDTVCITSDDLIPILVKVIYLSRCKHIESNIYYMEKFYWSIGSKDKDDLSYSFVTLKAAVQYMQNIDTSEINLGDWNTQNEYKLNGNQESSSINDSSLSDSFWEVRSSNIDHKMQRITKMLEDSMLEWQRAEKKVPRSIFGGEYVKQNSVAQELLLEDQSLHRSQSPKASELGEFLTSLQEDVFSDGFGKLA